MKHLGIAIFLTDLSIDPSTLAKAAEERGFYSLYFPEHTHIPASRETPAPTGEPVLPEEYSRTFDPFIASAVSLEATKTIKVGTGVSLILQHHPIALAKTVASLDHLSGGRFVFGTGYGWNKEEMAHHGIDYNKRRTAFREWLLGMYELWGNEAGEFHGEFVNFSPSWSWPKPNNKRPKVLIGGAGGEKLFDHIGELADGWMPIGGAGMKDNIPTLQAAVERHGRTMDEIDIVPFGVLPDEDKLKYYESLGITEAVLRLESLPENEALKELDKLAEYIN